MSRARSILFRYLLPGVVFSFSLQSWVSYHLSLRVYDDAPAPSYWYGDLVSACLNFPAFVYSAFAQPLWRLGFRVGRVYVEPRIIVFFVIVIIFWGWIGAGIERKFAFENQNSIHAKPSKFWLVALGLAASLWILVSVGITYDLLWMLKFRSWYYLRYVALESEIMTTAQLLWSVLLGVYFSRRFARGIQSRSAG
jgi:hypothetical protein